jgi:aryl-alcohol dehydrogenase-like predicted oxidoreductase
VSDAGGGRGAGYLPELGITLIAYQPLAQGVLTGKYRPGDQPKGVRCFGRYFRRDGLEKAQPVVALLGEIGDRYSKTLPRWRCGG